MPYFVLLIKKSDSLGAVNLGGSSYEVEDGMIRKARFIR